MARTDYSTIEALEARIAPAGLITASLKGGSLFISGDTEDNEVTFIQVNAHTFAISSSTGNIELDLPGSADPAPAASITFTGFKANVVVSMGDGDDSVTIGQLFTGKNLTIDAGSGNNTILLKELQLSGNIQVKGGDGGNALGLEGVQIKGSLKSTFGNGSDTVIASLIEAKSVSASLADGDDNFRVQDARIGGAFSVNAGNGSNEVTFDSLILEIRGALSVIHGNDALSDTTSIGPDHFKAGSVFIQNGNGGSETTLLTDFLETGPVRILNGSGNDNVAIRSVFMNLKSIFVDGGNGNDLLQVSEGLLNVAGDVVFKGGEGDDVARISAPGTIGGNVTLDLGAGSATQAVQIEGVVSLNLAKSLTIKSASTGTTPVDISNTAVNASARIDVSQGTGSLAIVGLSVRGALDARLGSGNDTVNIEDSLFNGSFSLLTGDGADTVAIETAGVFETRFNNVVKISLGGGNDSLTVGAGTASSRAVFAKKVTFDGGDGTDTESTANGNLYPNKQPQLINFP